MEQLLRKTKRELGGFAVFLLPLGLWGMVWLGIQPGSFRNVFDPGSFTDFVHGLRAASPFVAALAGAVYVLIQISKREKRRYFFYSPLALAAVYGLIGVAVSLRSPDTSLALYWATIYLTVPLVLWVATMNPDPLRQIERIIQFNWLTICSGFVVFFAIGLIALDLGDVLLSPSDLAGCKKVGSWFLHSSGALRSTGVGRFAAVTGIIAMTLLWKGNLRAVWAVVLVASIALLLSTGARGSMVAFGVAIPVVFCLMGGRRSKFGAVIAIAILAPILWSTGTAESFVRKCLLTETAASQVDYLGLRSPEIFVDQASSNGIPTSTSTPTKPAPGPQDTGGDSSQGALKPTPTPQDHTEPGGPSEPIRVQSETTIPAPPVQPAGPAPGTQATGGNSAGEDQGPTPPPSDESTPRVQNEPIPAPGGNSTREGQGPTPTPPGPRLQNGPTGVPSEPTIVVDDDLTTGFLTGTGRTQIWAAGWKFIELSPILGYGFHADRLVLGTHMHNATLHALIQTGFLGAIPFIGAVLWAWFILIKMLRGKYSFSPARRILLVQAAGMLVFFTVRSLPESTGAFFGIDWILVGPILIYLRMLQSEDAQSDLGA